MITIRYWFNKFKRDRTNVIAQERTFHSADVATEEIVEKVHDMILADRWLKVRKVAETIGVPCGPALTFYVISCA